MNDASLLNWRLRNVFVAALVVAATQLSTVSRAAPQKSDDRNGVVSLVIVASPHQSANGPDVFAPLFNRTSALKQKPTFVLVLGDITASGSAADFERVKQTVKQSADAGIPIYACPGPSDVSPLAPGKEPFARVFNHLYHSFDLGAAHFVLLDTTIANRVEGHVDKAQLDWLDRDLKRVRPEQPVLLFVTHPIAQESPATRLFDNDYELMAHLKTHNVVAVFTGDPAHDTSFSLNGTMVFGSRPLSSQSALIVTATPAIVTVDRIEITGTGKPEHLVSLPANPKSKPSSIKTAWDDPDIPFLARKRPAATLSPRAVSDNPDKEKGEYRIDSGPWKPLTKDRRDIWSDVFPTRDLSIGIHSSDLRITTSGGLNFLEELIFEVERDSREPTRRWAIDLPAPIQTSPCLNGDSLYVTALDGKVYACSTATGKRHWIFPAKGSFVTSPVVFGGLVIAGSTDRTLYAIEANGANAGRLKWKWESNETIYATAAAAHGTVCVPSGNRIVGIDLETGVEKWHIDAAGPFTSSVVTDDEYFYVTSSSGTTYAAEALTGAVRWKFAKSSAANTGSSTAPGVAAGRVYVAAQDGALYCLDSVTGAEKWFWRPGGEMDPLRTCSPTLCGTNVIVPGTGPNGDVYAVNGTSGTLEWRTITGQRFEGVSARAAQNGRSVAIMGIRGHCSILNNADGTRLWGYELGPGNIYSTPEYDGNLLYTTTMADDVQAINGPGVVK